VISPFDDFCRFWSVAVNIMDKVLFLYLCKLATVRHLIFVLGAFRSPTKSILGVSITAQSLVVIVMQ